MQHSRNKDGLWSDFLTLAGESIYWVSGYVGYALASYQRESDTEGWLTNVASNLLASQAADGGWSYGFGVPSDADSTSWCLRFLSKFTIQNQNRQDALSFLLKHQSSFDGGFRTYANPSAIGRYMMVDKGVSFEGWSSSQMCVTAAASLALMENRSTKGIVEAINYIRNGQTIEGYWNSYWWSCNLYATVNCMKVLKLENNKQDIVLIRNAQNWIAQNQLADGSWTDQTQETGWHFSTALALMGLMVEPNSRFTSNINSGIEWLLSNQQTDGSWSSNHILRIPHPSMKDPWNQTIWKKDGKAINAAIKDQNRLFTTATVFSTLAEFENRILG